MLPEIHRHMRNTAATRPLFPPSKGSTGRRDQGTFVPIRDRLHTFWLFCCLCFKYFFKKLFLLCVWYVCLWEGCLCMVHACMHVYICVSVGYRTTLWSQFSVCISGTELRSPGLHANTLPTEPSRWLIWKGLIAFVLVDFFPRHL